MIELVLGAVLALPMIFLFRLAGSVRERQLYALSLVVAALVYLLFARTAAAEWVLLEAGGVAVYGAVAILGLRVSPWFLSVGWALHVVWDAGIHLGGLTPFVPEGYPLLCIAFDLVVAVAVALRIRGVGGEARWGSLGRL